LQSSVLHLHSCQISAFYLFMCFSILRFKAAISLILPPFLDISHIVSTKIPNLYINSLLIAACQLSLMTHSFMIWESAKIYLTFLTPDPTAAHLLHRYCALC
jgi:hypothetical protein